MQKRKLHCFFILYYLCIISISAQSQAAYLPNGRHSDVMMPDTTGESNNNGLVDICNLPYYDMMEEMKKTNARLYGIHAGKLEPIQK